jgi:(p)ppGpp synthase/HD superfamily hydrolase
MRLSPRFEAALVMAAQLHAAQTRKGTETPYVSHLLSVSSLVLENGGTEDQAIAALLHDAVEDQGGKDTLERIRDHFGSGVADIVDHCTDAYVEPKPEWRQRKETYIEEIQGMPASAALVSCADKLHNARAILTDLRDIGEDLWSRFTGGKDGTLWYYRSLVDVFDKVVQNRLTDELSRTVEEIETLARQREY